MFAKGKNAEPVLNKPIRITRELGAPGNQAFEKDIYECDRTVILLEGLEHPDTEQDNSDQETTVKCSLLANGYETNELIDAIIRLQAECIRSFSGSDQKVVSANAVKVACALLELCGVSEKEAQIVSDSELLRQMGIIREKAKVVG